jgi:phage gp36-like protein
MAYSALADIELAIPEATVIQLTDDENSGVVDENIVSEAIRQADSVIDSYCSSRYGVPFSPVPDVIKTCSVDIAIYNLYSRRAEELPGTRKDRYNNAMKILEGIAKGIVTIGETTEPAREGGPQCNLGEDDKTFTKSTLGNY